MKRVIKLVVFLSIFLIVVVMLKNSVINKFDSLITKLDKINLDKISNLMIVAHPDDESLWGGAHLSKEDYLVVCVTCGTVKERQLEFEKAMSEFDNKYISLGYPDKTNNEKDNWANYYYKIENDIRKIINYKDWNTIVTHNPDGEYNHIHHKMVSTIVSNNSDKNKLFFFNKYYTKEELENINYCMKELNDKDLYAKNILLNDYPSQERSIKVDHIQNVKYENFIAYKNWK